MKATFESIVSTKPYLLTDLIASEPVRIGYLPLSYFPDFGNEDLLEIPEVVANPSSGLLWGIAAETFAESVVLIRHLQTRNSGVFNCT